MQFHAIEDDVRMPEDIDAGIALMNEDDVQPVEKREEDRVYRLFAYEDCTIPPNECKIIDTGVRIQVQNAFLGLIQNRSVENDVFQNLSSGMFDSNYTEVMKICLKNISKETQHINKYDYVANVSMFSLGSFISGLRNNRVEENVVEEQSRIEVVEDVIVNENHIQTLEENHEENAVEVAVENVVEEQTLEENHAINTQEQTPTEVVVDESHIQTLEENTENNAVEEQTQDQTVEDNTQVQSQEQTPTEEQVVITTPDETNDQQSSDVHFTASIPTEVVEEHPEETL